MSLVANKRNWPTAGVMRVAMIQCGAVPNIIHNKQLIARPREWVMGCLLRVRILIYIWPQFCCSHCSAVTLWYIAPLYISTCLSWSSLTHCGLVALSGDVGYHQTREWLVAPNHYLKQCWLLRNKLQWICEFWIKPRNIMSRKYRVQYVRHFVQARIYQVSSNEVHITYQLAHPKLKFVTNFSGRLYDTNPSRWYDCT